MQNGRLFHLLYLLLGGKKWTVTRLAQTLEVSKRTIQRDVDALSSAGIPIYTTQGRTGGVHLMPEFVLDRTLLSKQQQDEILCGLQTLHAAGVPEGKALLDELSGLFGQSAAHGWLDTDFSAWGEREENRSQFALIQRAILENHVLVIEYHAVDSGYSEREIEPVRLCFRGTAWYVQAFCRLRQEFRTFKLSRITYMQFLEETFMPYRALPPLPDYMEAAPSMVHAVLRFSPAVAYRVLDEFSYEQITNEPDGRLLVNTDWPAGSWGGYYLLSYGSLVEVLEPQELRGWVFEEAKKIAEQYKNLDIG